MIGRMKVLGVGIHAITMPEVLDFLERAIQDHRRGYVCVANVHTVMECQFDPHLRRATQESLLNVPDGMPLVWVARWSGYKLPDRVYGPDLMLALCERSSQRGYRNFFYGGSEATLQQLVPRLTQRFPGLRVVGAQSPPYRPLLPEEDAAAIACINSCEPDLVWVGLGAPKQEKWMYEHRNQLKASLLIGVGAAFDFHAGRILQAPPWMQKRGLEWAFRLVQEPRRLWRRYVLYNPLFASYLAWQWWRLKRSESGE